VLICQYKFLSRVAQEKHAPDAVPLFALIDVAASYRYGIVNLGGRDLADTLAKFDAVRNSLGIVLLPVGEPTAARQEASLALAAP
jgi:hypothetical protein